MAAKELKKVRLSEHQDRKQAISKTPFKDPWVMNNPIMKKNCARGKPLTTEEKKSMFKIYEENLQDFKDHKVPKPHAKAVKKTARSFGSSPTTLRNVVKEKGLFGNVRGAPYPRDTITIFEKLSVSQKDLGSFFLG